MCAIAGLIRLEFDQTIMDKMLATMLRRGPDANGKYISNCCGLLHSRLSIIDPAGGSQPMELEWAGESYTIVYNGELYNTEELRRELKALGHSFQGHSDTEVVLHAYAQWAGKALDLFNGIFAFGVWEERKKTTVFGQRQNGCQAAVL